MKKNKSIIGMLMLMIIPALIFSGCNKHDEITSPKNLNFDSPQFAIIDMNDVNNAIDDGTIDTPMGFNNSFFNYSFMNSNDFKPGNGMALMNMMGDKNWMVQFDWGKHLGQLLRKLNLTDDQKAKVKDAMDAFHTAMKPLVEQFRTANADIVKAANDKRKEILDKVKAGTLTRAEAKKLLDDLNKDTRDKIANNPATVALKAQMCAVKKTLLDSIRAILTGDQVTKWDVAMSKVPDPCK